MSNRTKGPPPTASTGAVVFSGIVALLTVGVVVVLVNLPIAGSRADVSGQRFDAAPAALGPPVPAALLIRPASHRLGPPAAPKVRIVEFLDFECEACRAVFPLVERLRRDYAARVEFVIRDFPLPSHPNAWAAALATEAAARQGRFESMYTRMYQTQPEWENRQGSQAATFRGFAVSLGLDMARYDADLADPTLAQRVLADRADGQALGLTGTPSLFLNDRPIEDVTGYDSLKTLIDQALATA